MLHPFQKVLIGTVGLAGSGVASKVIESVSIPIHDWTSALTQLVIAVVTVLSLFKRKKK